MKYIPNTYGGTICDGVVVDMGAHKMVYVSGLVGSDADGKVTAPTIEAEAELCFANLRRVMTEAGGTMADIVQIVAYVTELEHYVPYRAARNVAFGDKVPASATVQVAGLLIGARIEIHATGIIR